MHTGRPSLPSLRGDKLRTVGTVIRQQSVGFVRNTGGTARFLSRPAFCGAFFYFLKIIIEKEHTK